MTDHRIRSGSLQFYPRKRARRILHKINWDAFSKSSKQKKGLMGFIGYKVGMVSVFVKDSTEDSMTKNKRINIPGTIIECPNLRIYSVRFYKDKKIVKDIVVSNEKVLKRKVKISKNVKNLDKIDFEFDDVRVIVYSEVLKTGINQKKPDMLEMGVAGSKDEKLNFIKENLNKSISIADIFNTEVIKLADIRGITKSKGLQGPVKRFGITLKASKSEKGQRRPGSLSSFGLARVTFRAPQAGQLGGFSRITYNNAILQIGKISEKDVNKKSGFHKYGNIKTDYVILKGSIPGPRKKALVITPAIRPTRKTFKQNFEVLEIR